MLLTCRKQTYFHMHACTNIISGYAVAVWLGIRLQMLGVAMVTGVAFIAVLEHHFNTVNPGETNTNNTVNPGENIYNQ